MMRSNSKQNRQKQKIQCMHTALKRAKYLILIGTDRRVLQLEARGQGYREEPIENTRKCHQIVCRIPHSQGRYCRPSEESRRRDRKASKQQSFQGLDHAGILNLDPFELQREPDTNQERSLGAEQESEDVKGDG